MHTDFVIYYEGATPLGGTVLTREDKLFKKMEQGDPDAVEELIRLFYPDILRYCLWHAPNRSLAEDAAQETFLKAIRYFDRYTHKGKFKSFLYRIAANVCVDMQRKDSRHELSLEAAETDPAYAEPAFESIHSDMTMQQLVNSLPENQQEIVLLRFGQDLTLREIAETTGLPLRTVQTRLRAALKKLRKNLCPQKQDAELQTDTPPNRKPHRDGYRKKGDTP